MPKKPSGEFDQAKYMQQWRKQNMKTVNCSYKADFVDDFKAACQKLGVKQSDVIRQAMQDTIDKSKTTD